MKRYFVIILSVYILFLSSCSYTYKVDGIENFDVNLPEFGVNRGILPNENFISEYPYKNADYHYREDHRNTTLNIVEKSLVAFEYEHNDYLKAKEYCVKTMSLMNAEALEYNGYTFLYNQLVLSDFPHLFNMVVYNDSKCKLVFLGIYTTEYSSSEADAEEVKANWGEFVEEYFGDIHDWD